MNDSGRPIDAFFYGLFMDPVVLEKLGVAGIDARPAYVNDYALRIGNKATLIPSPGDRAFGVVYSMTRSDVDHLYAGPGLEAYRAEQMEVTTLNGNRIDAVCYNLSEAPAAHERNAEYADQLRVALAAWEFPADYIDGIR